MLDMILLSRSASAIIKNATVIGLGFNKQNKSGLRIVDTAILIAHMVTVLIFRTVAITRYALMQNGYADIVDCNHPTSYTTRYSIHTS